MRSQVLSLVARRLTIDADGFVQDELEPAEVEKAGRMPGWSYCDRQGPEIVSTKRVECERIAQDLRRQVANSQAVVAQLEKKLADAEQRALQLASEEAEAVLRAQKAKDDATKVDISALSWDKLRSYAAENGISAVGQSREAIESALATVLAPKRDAIAKAEADEVEVPVPKMSRRQFKTATA